MGKLDSLIVDNIKQTLLMPERLADILRALLERQGIKIGPFKVGV
jgi:hypothetical protein